MATSKRVVIAPSALDKNAPPDVTVMYRLCHKPVGRQPPAVIADHIDQQTAQDHADDLSKRRIPFLYLTWWRRDGKQVKKWATLLHNKSRHYKVTVPYVDGITDEMVKVLLQNAILHAAAKPREYNETNVKVRADPDLNRLEVDDQLVQVRLPQPVALVLRSMPATEASALVEKAITGDNAEPAAEVVELTMTGPKPGKHINPLRELPVGTKLYTI